MENHHRPAKRRREKAVAGAMEEEEEDRISQLPGLILDHILSFLPQNDAFRTCILSKSWRHLGPTGPKIEFHETSFRGRKEKFLSVVDNTLKRYEDQNRSILEFVLGISRLSRPSVSLLEKWIPKVVKNMGVLSFNLRAPYFSLPSVVFEAEFLAELKLVGCQLDQINNNCFNVKLHVLKRLELHCVYIEEKTFEKIISSCPLIQHLVLHSCLGLKTVKVNKACNLKRFHCYFSMYEASLESSIEINDNDGPSLETIGINGGYLVKINKNNYFFPGLKSLNLCHVHLPTEWLNNLSSNNNFPCLEELELLHCSGFTEFELSNCSIKRLVIVVPDRPITAAIDAANMLYFEYQSSYLPTFSFSTISREWKTKIVVCRSSNADDLSTWSLKLYEFLKSLRQSQISLEFSNLHLTNEDSFGLGSCEPVVVQHFYLSDDYSSPALRVVLNCLFRIFRSRYIGLSDSPKRNVRKLAKSIWNTLVKNGGEIFWQHDLEETSFQVLEENANEWRPGQVCEFSNDEKIRFMLKWREKR